MRIPDKFVRKHARPGETMGQGRRRLMRELMKNPDVHVDPAAALKKLDLDLFQKAEAKMRKQFEF